jgi:DNA-binding IclR family transcriptional regulator
MRGSDRLLNILTSLGAERGQTLSELADGLGLPRPTTLRFLRSLEEGGWVLRDDRGRYSLGPAVVTLATQYLWTDHVLVVASPQMAELRDRVGETVSLSRRVGARRVCVQEFPSPESLRLILGLGDYGPLHAGASGLVLLAALPGEERRELMEGRLERLTSRTITTLDGLDAECERVAAQGFSVTHSQRTPGGVAVAVPVRDAGAPNGVSALAIYAPETRSSAASERAWIEVLRTTAQSIEEAAPAVQTAPAVQSAPLPT